MYESVNSATSSYVTSPLRIPASSRRVIWSPDGTPGTYFEIGSSSSSAHTGDAATAPRQHSADERREIRLLRFGHLQHRRLDRAYRHHLRLPDRRVLPPADADHAGVLHQHRRPTRTRYDSRACDHPCHLP